MRKLFIIYEERAITMDTMDATVMVVCENLKEARNYKGDFGKHCPVYSYDDKDGNLINETFVEII